MKTKKQVEDKISHLKSIVYLKIAKHDLFKKAGIEDAAKECLQDACLCQGEIIALRRGLANEN